MSELWLRTAEETAAAVRSGEESALAVVEESLARIEAVDPSVGAYLLLMGDEARQQAEAIDARQRCGDPLGRLAGVPVALKDNLAVAGQPLTCGSRILEGFVSPYTATAVERLVAEDAVVIGKVNLDEFAMGSSCENSALRLTRNPWNLDKVPGGSSGGSAAAVASSTVPIALGSDTGGSIRQPAALCGVVGLKPTYGRVSRYGLVAFASSLDQVGPISRTVRDAALTLSVIAGADTRDATSKEQPVPDYFETIEEGMAGIRIGILEEVETETLAPAVRDDWQSMLSLLTAQGAELCSVSIPHLRAAIAAYYVVANSEASANLARFDGVRYGHRAADVRSLRQLYDESRHEGFGAEVKRRIMLGTYALSAGYYEAYYGRAVGVCRALRQQFKKVFETVDVLACPSSPCGAFGIGEKVEDPLAMYLMDIFTTPANLVGVPGIAIPSGLDEEGMPLSLQLLAPAFDEGLLFRVSRAVEQARQFDDRPQLPAASEASG